MPFIKTEEKWHEDGWVFGMDGGVQIMMWGKFVIFWSGKPSKLPDLRACISGRGLGYRDTGESSAWGRSMTVNWGPVDAQLLIKRDPGFPDSSVGKESACNEGDPRFNSWVGKIRCRRKRLPTPVFWPGEFQGLYSPRGLRHDWATFPFTFLSTATWPGSTLVIH